jgi:6-phosphogluconolactonase
MSNMIQIFPTSERTIKEIANFIFILIKKSAEAKKNFFWALSGGNTPKLLFEELKINFKDKIDWSYVHLFWGDERCVSYESTESNYGEAKRLFLDQIDIPKENIHPVFGDRDSVSEAERYSDEIKSIVPLLNDLPNFDLIILGIGEDGHTASIFPNQMHMMKSDKICEVAIHPVSAQKRITITGKTINNSKIIVFLVTGEKKSKILSEIINKNNKNKNHPAAQIIPKFGNLYYFLDKESSKNL